MTTEGEQTKKEVMIREAMETFGLDRVRATFMIRQHLGETDCDVHETSALSEQERHALGLGISLEEAIRRDEERRRRSA